jgi:hypothetical protein
VRWGFKDHLTALQHCCGWEATLIWKPLTLSVPELHSTFWIHTLPLVSHRAVSRHHKSHWWCRRKPKKLNCTCVL